MFLVHFFTFDIDRTIETLVVIKKNSQLNFNLPFLFENHYNVIKFNDSDFRLPTKHLCIFQI